LAITRHRSARCAAPLPLRGRSGSRSSLMSPAPRTPNGSCGMSTATLWSSRMTPPARSSNCRATVAAGGPEHRRRWPAVALHRELRYAAGGMTDFAPWSTLMGRWQAVLTIGRLADGGSLATPSRSGMPDARCPRCRLWSRRDAWTDAPGESFRSGSCARAVARWPTSPRSSTGSAPWRPRRRRAIGARRRCPLPTIRSTTTGRSSPTSRRSCARGAFACRNSPSGSAGSASTATGGGRRARERQKEAPSMVSASGSVAQGTPT
jgi:hypothetical protein